MENWKNLRRFSLQSLRDYGFGKKQSMEKVIHLELSDLINELDMQSTANNGIHNMHEFFTLSLLNILWSMVAGTRYLHDDPQLIKLMKINETLFRSGNFGNSILFAFPALRNYFPVSTGMQAQWDFYNASKKFFRVCL